MTKSSLFLTSISRKIKKLERRKKRPYSANIEKKRDQDLAIKKINSSRKVANLKVLNNVEELFGALDCSFLPLANFRQVVELKKKGEFNLVFLCCKWFICVVVC